VTAFDGRDDWQGTFLDNHDELRTLVRLQKLGVQSRVERERRLDLGTVLLMTARGIPIIFYGDEQYLAHYDDGHDTPPRYINSDNDDPFNRLGMTQFSEDTSNFKIIATLANLRANGSALASGSYRGLSADQDTLVFERRQGPERVLVAVNRGPARDLTLASLDVRAGSYPSLLADTSDVNRTARLDVAPDGSATLHLEQLGALVVRPPAASP
jgi:glycosidase